MKKILIVSPHPDDEILGCGGTILKFNKKNYDIYWLVVTSISKKDGWQSNQVKIRNIEKKQVKKLFNFKKLINLNFPTRKIDQLNLLDLIEKFSDVIKSISPNLIYLPFISDPHSDHRIITEAFQACVKPFRFQSIEKVMMYETLSETNLNFFNSRKFNPNIFEDISPLINKKIKMLDIYKSEFSKHPFPRSKESVKSLAILRGSQCYAKYAEAFELVYEISRD